MGFSLQVESAYQILLPADEWYKLVHIVYDSALLQ